MARLEHFYQVDSSDDILVKINNIKLALNLEADKEELFCGQRTRSNWLHHGNHNISFYHRFASFCKHTNMITALVDAIDRLYADMESIFGVANGYFQDLFTLSCPDNFN